MLTDLVIKDKNQGHSQGENNAPVPIKSINDKDEEYKEKTLKCRKLLEDVRWTWRTDVMLMRESELTEDEFNNFVRTDQYIVKSKINDINGNRLFSLRSKLS